MVLETVRPFHAPHYPMRSSSFLLSSRISGKLGDMRGVNLVYTAEAHHRLRQDVTLAMSGEWNEEGMGSHAARWLPKMPFAVSERWSAVDTPPAGVLCADTYAHRSPCYGPHP